VCAIDSFAHHCDAKLNRIRVKDPKRSVEFYEFLGLKQINKLENPDAKFDLYFLAYDSPSAVSHGNHWTDREGIVELTHNYGTENDPDYKVANGNSDPGRGFGHLAISVDNIQAACQRIEDAGYKFQKKLTDGKMRHIAFALDPDGYWVEISRIPTPSSTSTSSHTIAQARSRMATIGLIGKASSSSHTTTAQRMTRTIKSQTGTRTLDVASVILPSR
jgi:lactoylglutathione lyase